MPVSFNLRDKVVWIRKDIESQSLEIVHKMLNEGEVNELTIEDIPLDLFQSLNLKHVKGLSIGNIPCYDLGFLSSIDELKYLKLGFSSIPEDKKGILTSMPVLKDLRTLFLEGKAIGNLNRLPMLPALEVLQLKDINDESLAFLEKYPLVEDMWISGCNLVGYQHLVNSKKLVRLRVFESPIDFKEMMSGGSVNHSLQILEICECSTLKSLKPLRVFEKLRYLEISDCKNLRSKKGIEDCKSLELINVLHSVPVILLKKAERFLLADIISIFNSKYRKRIAFLRQLDRNEKRIDYGEHYARYFQGSLVYPTKK